MAKDRTLDRIAKDAEEFARPFRVTKGRRFRLEDVMAFLARNR